jgi:hypothetical protein
MATIRKRGNKYQSQIRKDGYKTVSRTFSSVSVARSWAKAVGLIWSAISIFALKRTSR